MSFSRLLLLTAGISVLSACMASPIPSHKTTLGTVLVDSQGKTLYTFTKDAPGKSNCKGGCAQKWPPYMAASDAKAHGNFDIITREDGTKQWAYKNQPLYTWVGDTKKGDTTGHGIKNVWFAAIVDQPKPARSSSYGSY